MEDVDIEARIGIGELLVLVPDGAEIVIDAHVGIGNIDALGETKSGRRRGSRQPDPCSGRP